MAKYLVVMKRGLETPILFPEYLNHEDVKNQIVGELISAGYCRVEEGKVSIGKGSLSLRIESRKDEDGQLLTKLLFT